MKILALDISTTCTGWAVLNTKTEKFIATGKIVTPSYYAGLTKNDLLMGQALFWFCKKIKKLITEYKPTYVCAEDINIGYASTMKSMSQFHAVASIAYSIWDKSKVLNKVHNATMRSELGMGAIVPNDIKKKWGKMTKVDMKIKCMVHNVNKKNDGINVTWEEGKSLMKENKVDTTKVLVILIMNFKFGLMLSYDRHDEADAMALAWTFYRRKLDG